MALAAVLAAAAGCGTPGTPTPAGDPTTSAASSTPAGDPAADPALAGFYGQRVQWGSCVGYESDPFYAEDFAEPYIECGRVEVPLDYAEPGGERAQIAVRRKPAAGQRTGSLVFNPGGPGIAGLPFVESLASSFGGLEAAQGLDLVAFDPRGIGASRPEVRCLTGPERDAVRADPQVDYSEAGIARIEQASRDYAQACVDKSGRALLANIGTRDVARDLDILRAALGDDKLNYLGYSYGTFIGAIYAEAFGHRVRAMVLDGVVDPNEDPVEDLVKTYTGFQNAFDEFAADCAQREGCPLGGDPALAVRRYRALVDPLIETPAATEDPRGLSYPDALTGTFNALYSSDSWEYLRTGLTELAQGRGDELLFLADVYEERLDDGSYTNASDAFTSVLCVDSPPVTDREVAALLDKRLREVAPFVDDGRATGQAPLDDCAFWPVPHTLEPHTISAEGLPRVLVVSTTGDPATPYEAGVVLAEQLGGALLTVEGTKHTATLGGNACADEVLDRYLVDLEVPEDGARC